MPAHHVPPARHVRECSGASVTAPRTARQTRPLQVKGARATTPAASGRLLPSGGPSAGPAAARR